MVTSGRRIERVEEMAETQLYATSDVSRDILQNADYFTAAGKSVAEYGWNCIDYCRPNARVEVHIRVGKGKIPIRKKRYLSWKGIIIEETKNGGGMSREDLERFFTMHAETEARARGLHVRGRYGTGKSAAFGIGKRLIVETVKDGRRNVVSLSRLDLMPGLTRVPVTSHLIDQQTDQQDGTTIIIDDLKLKKIKVKSMRDYLTRSMNRILGNHDIFVDGERLEYIIPEWEREWSFDCPADSLRLLGPCKLIIRLAKVELGEENRGIAILSKNYQYETLPVNGLGGAWGPRLFGEIDSLLLDSEDDIPPFDNTRSTLNRENERVRVMIDWIVDSIKIVVKDLDAEAKAVLDQQMLEQLKQTEQEISQILNQDFSEVLRNLESSPTVAGVGNIAGGVSRDADNDKLLVKDSGGSVSYVTQPDGETPVLASTATGERPVSPNPSEPDRGQVADSGDRANVISSGTSSRKPRGGFSLVHRSLGVDAHRAVFVRENMQIQVNLDHPELATFKKDVEDFRFKALSAEIAISEYAFALVNIMVEKGSVDVENTASSAMIEVRRIVNRLGRKLEGLYKSWLVPPSS